MFLVNAFLFSVFHCFSLILLLFRRFSRHGPFVAKRCQNFSGKAVAKHFLLQSCGKTLPLYFGIEFRHSFATRVLPVLPQKEFCHTIFATKSVLPQFCHKRREPVNGVRYFRLELKMLCGATLKSIAQRCGATLFGA